MADLVPQRRKMGKTRYKCVNKRRKRIISQTNMKIARDIRWKPGYGLDYHTNQDTVDVGSTKSDDDVERTNVVTDQRKLISEGNIVDDTRIDDESDQLIIEVEKNPACADENKINRDIEGKRIIDFWYFMDQLYTIDAHGEKFGCRLSHLKFMKECQSGFISTFHLKCTMCGSIFCLKTSEENNGININSGAVSGAIMTGIGLSCLNELSASIDLPTLSFRLYSQCHDRMAEIWKNTAEETMQKAAEEEAEAAKLRGDVSQAGIPTIAVQADACWSKRSYKSNYSALSGVAAIIREHSGKVLHIGVRNKYCVICIRAKKRGVPPRPHKCTINHFGSSSSMEQNILVEGFKNSIKEKNLIYKTLIADGDASTYKNILENRPYPDISIQKIECTNHLLRNYNGRNLRLLKDTSIPKPERDLLTVDRQTRLRTAIRSAIKYRCEENGTVTQKIQKLQQDIINSPWHVFGEHRKCAGYYCTEDRKKERNMVPKVSTLILKLKTNAEQLARNSRSLLHCSTNNRAEQFNSIVAKVVGGKRINFSLKNSYEARCYAAVVAFNTGKAQYTLYKSTCNRSPGKSLKRLENARQAKNKRDLQIPKIRRRKKINFGLADYGSQCQRPDLNADEYKEAKILFLNNLKDQAENRHEIERNTILQAESSLRLELRRSILTASTFSKVCKRRPNTNSAPLVKSILYSYNLDHVASIKHGKDHESIAIAQLSAQEKITVEKCGLFIDAEYCYLGASPDGLYSDGLIEVKCPISGFGMDFDTAVRTKKIKGFKFSDSCVTLTQNHDWFYQIQGQLHIANRNICLLTIWTGPDYPVKVIKIQRNKRFWEENMLPKLKAFYENCILPEIIDSRKARSMPLREIFSN